MKNKRQPSVIPKDAASLVVVRKRWKTIEVLMGQRTSRHRFMPNVFVFPGGRLDNEDMYTDVINGFRPDVEKKLTKKWSSRLAKGLGVAAVRETYEETGLEIGTRAKGKLRPDLNDLNYIARAITPISNPIRFHARFFSIDSEKTIGRITDSAELLNLNWRSLEDSLKLSIADVTEFILQELQRQQVGWKAPGIPLFSYRGGHMMIHYEG